MLLFAVSDIWVMILVELFAIDFTLGFAYVLMCLIDDYVICIACDWSIRFDGFAWSLFVLLAFALFFVA